MSTTTTPPAPPPAAAAGTDATTAAAIDSVFFAAAAATPPPVPQLYRQEQAQEQELQLQMQQRRLRQSAYSPSRDSPLLQELKRKQYIAALDGYSLTDPYSPTSVARMPPTTPPDALRLGGSSMSRHSGGHSHSRSRSRRAGRGRAGYCRATAGLMAVAVTLLATAGCLLMVAYPHGLAG
eukprot:SAG22_NODE_1071_length_5708_cov_8.431093_3_plen_179_part_01